MSAVPPPPSETSGGMQAVLASLGIGTMPAYRPEADTLEGEVDEYLEAPIIFANIIEFWQVSKNGLWC
jgi:hypothetical protein